MALARDGLARRLALLVVELLLLGLDPDQLVQGEQTQVLFLDVVRGGQADAAIRG